MFSPFLSVTFFSSWQFFWAGLADAREITTGDTINVASVKFFQAIKEPATVKFNYFSLHTPALLSNRSNKITRSWVYSGSSGV